MCVVFDLVDRFAPTEVTVTFLGETGTGKDVLAHLLHEKGRRAGGPFAVFTARAWLPTSPRVVVRARARAFTGALSKHIGAFSGPTAERFLDEIGELPVDLQPRLLRCWRIGV
jgi:DNA-binding NtrC family response regulator